MKVRLPLWGRIIPAAIAAVLLPGILKILLQAELSWPLLVTLVLGKIVLSAVSLYLRGSYARAFALLSTLYSVCFAVIVLAGILISPYSAYGIWFEMVRDGEPRGLVSNVMVLLAAVFSSALARRFLDSEILLSVYGQLLVAAGLLALIYQNRLFYTLLLCMLAMGSIVLSLRFGQPGNRLRHGVTFFLLFSALLALARLPLLWAEPRGSRLVDDRLHPGLRKAIVELFPRFPLLYGIPGYGFGFENDRLGGTPILSAASIFEIQGRPGQQLYLRTGSYSIYDGQSWSKLKIPVEEPSRTQEPNAGEALRFLALEPQQAPASSLRITVLTEYYTLLPFTLNTRAIYLPSEQIEGISGNFEEGYRLAAPLRSGQSIYLRFGQTGSQGGAPVQALSAAEANRYLQLPGSISPELRELAISLADAAGDPRSALRNIERYLARNYTYNLEAERTPPGADFVETFLFQNKEGYCVHFASAFAVLARLNRIPVRYATGYLAYVPGGSFPFEGTGEPGRDVVTGLSAHAWPEVWLEDRGWVAWEATTAVNPSYYEEIGEQWLYEYDREENRLTNRQLHSILGREPGSRQRGARGLWGIGLWSINWPILLLAIPILAVLWLAFRGTRRYGILLAAALRPGRSSALQLAAKIADSFHRRGVEWPHMLGWVRWTEKIGEAAACSAAGQAARIQARSRRLLRVMQRLVYSDNAFRRLDLRFIRLFYLTYCARSNITR
jgi:transglutaminase-like putative cysteine protease